MITKTNDNIMPLRKYQEKEYVKVDSDNGFDQYLVKFVTKKFFCSENKLFRNKKTGEIVGKTLKLHIWFYDENWNYYPEGIEEKREDFETIPDPDYKPSWR